MKLLFLINGCLLIIDRLTKYYFFTAKYGLFQKYPDYRSQNRGEFLAQKHDQHRRNNKSDSRPKRKRQEASKSDVFLTKSKTKKNNERKQR